MIIEINLSVAAVIKTFFKLSLGKLPLQGVIFLLNMLLRKKKENWPDLLTYSNSYVSKFGMPRQLPNLVKWIPQSKQENSERHPAIYYN